MFADRFARAITDGDLREDSDPAALARYFLVVSEGHAVQKGAAISRSALEQSVDIALSAFAVSCSPV